LELLLRFKEYLAKNNLIKKGDSILLGVSGGPDSLTMLHLFVKIKKEYRLDLVVFHLNHMFRKEASNEAAFVKKQAENYGLEAVIEEFNVPQYIKKKGLSPEEAAREIRFKFMQKWASKFKLKKIALAHNRDDLVETVFLNVIRGTGLKGLTGIEPVTSYGELLVIHPLLNIYRQEIEAYCQLNGLSPVYDPTNKENMYTRNKLRNEVIPYLEREINPGLKGVIARMAENIRVEENYLSQRAKEEFRELLVEKTNRELILSLSGIKEQHVAIRNRVLKKAIGLLKGNYIDLYSKHYQDINRLILEGQTGKYIELIDDIRVRLSYDKLIIEKGNSYQTDFKGFSYELPVPGQVSLPDGQVLTAEEFDELPEWRTISSKPEICICDQEKLQLPLLIRNRKPGDRFQPLGMKGLKKIKDFFIDEKIPANKRDSIPIICDNSGQIIWIAGYRMDDRYKVTKKTNKLLKLRINYQEGD